MPRRLRAFFRTRTLQGSTGQFALSGKDAILTRGGSPIQTYVPPDWLDPLPLFSFTNGIPSSQTFSGYFTEGNGGTSTITGANLPAGVTVNSAAKTLVYDGNGAIASSATATLTADDGYEDFTAITSLVVRETAGTAGMVFKEGDVPADRYVVSSTGALQSRVKNSWPDGSAKIAVLSWSGVTASQASPATLSIGKTATPPTGSDLTVDALRGLGLTGSVSLGTYGSVNLTTIIAGAPFRTWLYGPKCSEWHWRSQVGTDPTLVVWIYVRLYANGRVWVRATVENGYVFAGERSTSFRQTGKQYRAVITLNGTTRYDSNIDSNLTFPRKDTYGSDTWYWPWTSGGPIPHPSRTRWSLEFWYDGGAIQAPGHDGAYIIASKLVPNYSTVTSPPQAQYDYVGWATRVVPLGIADHRPDQSIGSAAFEIAYLPKWDVLHLLATQGSENQARMFNVVVANAVAAGTYGFMRDEVTNLPVLWSDRPLLWSQYNSGDYNAIGYCDKITPYRAEAAHEPAWSYYAYLITGDFLHLETMQERATADWIGLNYNEREGAKGYIWGYNIQTRRFAWSFRNFSLALCITPDSSDVSTYDYKLGSCYRNAVANNAERYIASHITGTYAAPGYTFNCANTFGWIVSNMNFGYSEDGSMNYYANEDTVRTNDGVILLRGHAPWQQAFAGSALAAACDMKIVSGGSATNLATLTDFTLSFTVQMCGLGDSSGFPYPLAGTVCVPLYGKMAADPNWSMASSWTDIYNWRRTRTTYPDLRPLAPSGAPMFSTYGYEGASSDPGNGNGYAGSPSDWLNSYWVNFQPALSYAVERGVTGATAARARMMSQSGTALDGRDGNWATYAAQLPTSCQWNVVPR